MNCLLCSQKLDQDPWVFTGDTRLYLQCSTCHLVQCDPTFFPDFESCKSRYSLHEPDAGSKGHLSHLQNALVPATRFILPDHTCLDYGCGPVPVLSGLLKSMGIPCDNYDPYFDYFFDKSNSYDHVFCLETAEHFFDPLTDWNSMFNHVKPGGNLILLTERYTDASMFESWYYKRDKTHVIFYHDITLGYIVTQWKVKVSFDDGKRVTIFNKVKV